MMYQPQMTREGKLLGVEALIRWETNQLSTIPPDQFIPIAESSGDMIAIGKFVIEQSLKDIVEIREVTGEQVRVSINISVQQFQHHHFLSSLLDLIQKYQFTHCELMLEVTENLFIDDVIGMRSLMHQIKDKGIRISLDDFGTGYSSLSLLNQLPIDELKIDKNFIDQLTTDHKAFAMVECIIGIAKKLNITTVAEGVETEAQRQILESLQCDIYQGYYYAKPLTTEALKHFIFSQDIAQNKAFGSVERL